MPKANVEYVLCTFIEVVTHILEGAAWDTSVLTSKHYPIINK